MQNCYLVTAVQFYQMLRVNIQMTSIKLHDIDTNIMIEVWEDFQAILCTFFSI